MRRPAFVVWMQRLYPDYGCGLFWRDHRNGLGRPGMLYSLCPMGSPAYEGKRRADGV